MKKSNRKINFRKKKNQNVLFHSPEWLSAQKVGLHHYYFIQSFMFRKVFMVPFLEVKVSIFLVTYRLLLLYSFCQEKLIPRGSLGLLGTRGFKQA